MRIDPAGFPFIVGALAAALLAGIALGWPFAIPLVVLAAFFLFFFRDPERQVVAADDAVLSPADGRVLVAGPAEATAAPPGEWLQISIFLSPMDVHVNRVPVSGRVTQRQLSARALSAGLSPRRGRHQRAERDLDRSQRPADRRRGRSSACSRGASSAGCGAGAEVRAGDRYGVMKFGSRMDVFLPTDAELRVKVGRRRAGR